MSVRGGGEAPVEWSLWEAGSSKGKAPWRQLFLSSSESAGSPEVEERVASPPRSRGKGWALIQELDLGEVTGVICDLCEKKGIPCRWGKVSLVFCVSFSFFC